MQTLLNRLKEKSTWAAIVGLVTAIFGLTVEEGEAIIAVGVAISSAAGVFIKESGSPDA